MKKSELTILFDANPMVNSRKTGVGYYTYQLIDAIAKNHAEVKLIGHYFNFLGRKQPVLPKHPNITYRSSTLLPGKVLALARRFGVQAPFDILIKSRGDVALFPNFVALPCTQTIKKAIVIHDLCFEDFPEYVQPANRSFLKRFVPLSAKRADAIFTVSKATKDAVIDHYKVIPDKIQVTHIPPPVPISPPKTTPENLNIPKKYILFVGTLEPRKNYISLVRAYARLPDSIRSEYGLVLAGGHGWGSDEDIAEIEQLQRQNFNIIVTGYVSEKTRAYLYKNASLLVLPSHYEGFGMPILEGMSYGTTVALSDIPVFHEIAKNAALYFNKDDERHIAQTIENLLTNPKLCQQLQQESAQLLKEYSWDNISAQVIERIKSLAGKE